MKRLHSYAFYALVTPAITLGAGSVLAEQSTDQDAKPYGSHPAVESYDQDAKQSTTQSDQGTQLDSHPAVEGYDQDARQSTSRTTQSDQQRAGDFDSHPAVEGYDQDAKQSTTQSDQGTQLDSHPAVESTQRDQSRMQNRGYMKAAPAKGMQASNLIGAKVKTAAGEEVGPVRDVIIDENGQVVAIVVGVGGFLGIGQRDVAIGWDDVTRSGAPDEQELRIDLTRESLRSAPKFESSY